MKHTTTVTSKDGTMIAYDKIGQGPVVILVLGALNSRKSGAKLAKLLASNFTVISYDRRGLGDSTDTAPYTPLREVEDLAALIDEIGGPVYLYGHSSGSAIVLHAANKLSKQIKKLALYVAPYSVDKDSIKASKAYDKQLKKVLASGDKGEAVALFIRFVGVSEKQVQALKRLPMWKGLASMAPTLAYESGVLGEGHYLPTALLAGITTPSLVMHGGKGSPQMRDAAEAISKTIPKAKLRTLAEQTHGVSPNALAPVLVEFFSE
jgi:pimeloyl-ACP methyl ester carboxylesterase